MNEVETICDVWRRNGRHGVSLPFIHLILREYWKDDPVRLKNMEDDKMYPIYRCSGDLSCHLCETTYMMVFTIKRYRNLYMSMSHFRLDFCEATLEFLGYDMSMKLQGLINLVTNHESTGVLNEKIIDSYKVDWKSDKLSRLRTDYEHKLYWVSPTEGDKEFIGYCVKELKSMEKPKVDSSKLGYSPDMTAADFQRYINIAR
jgi:hypothetical protein